MAQENGPARARLEQKRRREAVLRSLLFEMQGARRFTQDTPILPEVWISYDTPDDPFAEPQDLLLTPSYGGLAGRVAQELRPVIDEARTLTGRPPARIVHLPGVVAASLYLDELLQIVLPRTNWWHEQMFKHANPGAPSAQPAPSQEDQAAAAKSTLPLGLDWLVDVVAFLVGTGDAPDADDEAKAEQAVIGHAAFDTESLPPITIGRVATNRPAEPAITQSTLAVKADAARLLFNVSCASVTWAIIDSGIDGSHPAFASHDPVTGAPGPTRVIGTYDLTLIQQLLDPRYISSLFREGAALTPEQQTLKARYQLNLKLRGMADTDAPRLGRQLADRLDNGFELDWGLIEPFLWVEAPGTPSRGHGTMVAGVLGADWRGDQAPYTVRMQGICPDIKLYDFRVIGADGSSQEFDVVAALQLIRYLNAQADRRTIHGANLSLSTIHDVTSYACGSTLICQECDRTWASGVVLVAAAGNRGHERYMLAGGAELGGYNSTSITDPGNAEGVITVGATHRAFPHQYGVSYFSSRGPTGDGRSKPDLVAPGEKITGPVPDVGLTTDDGTSLAAPHVSGAAAMLMARNAELAGRPQRIKEILCGTATDLGRERYFQGAGMLDILRALQSV
ncbi:S8 family peptidase [Sphingosinicella sp. BN140058]|uniref:S8 family peptidase n=1 Tax=Sphingosinicella sp. BN140058 TaxID=1892855 RepID=UPI0019813E1B|nr:S8 family peptidase [Sphingosinicella sp. BN140058]